MKPAPLSATLLAIVLTGSALAEVRQATIDRLTASADAGPKYSIEKAHDGQANTHWAAPNRPPVWLQAHLKEAQSISRLRIRQPSQTSIYDNWRRIAVTFSDATTFSCILADRWQAQVVSFPRRKAHAVKITIESTYKTSHYVGLSELTLEDEGDAVHGRTGVSVDPPPQPLASESKPTTPGRVQPRSAKPGDREPSSALLARLSPPSFGPGHPTLFLGPDDVKRAAANIRSHAWARRVFAGILAGADRWLDLSDEQLRAAIPNREAMFDNKALCPGCGSACSADLKRPGLVACHKCNATYPDAKHPDAGRGWKNPKTGEVTYFVGLYNSFAVDRVTDGVQDLADAYVLTGDRRYAHVLSVLLDALAVIYPSCDKGPVWYPGVGGRLNRPFYQTARTLIYYASVYDLTHNSPEWDSPSCDPVVGTRRANYEKNLLGNGAEYCFHEVTRQKSPGLHNGNCDYLQGALAVGRVLGIPKYIDYVLESDLSIFNFIDNTIDRDGQYYETSFSYSQHAVELFSHHAEMLRNFRSPKYPNGVNLYDLPKLRTNYLRAERDIDCAGHQPALGDAGPDLAVTGAENRAALRLRVAERLEVLTARTSDPAQRVAAQRQLWQLADGDIDALRSSSHQTRWLLFCADDIPAPSPHENPSTPWETSTLLPGARGVAVLRSGSAQAGQRCALLRYGATLNHGSPDEMNVNLYAFGREISFDQGYGWAHHRAGWAHSTVAHNVVVVNEKNQLRNAAGSGGSLELFCQSPHVRVVAADAPLAYSAEGVRRYRRMLAMVDTGRDASYVVDTFDVVGGAQHDMSQHFVGNLVRTDGATFGPPQTSGSLAGPNYEWWKLIQPSGWLTGEKRQFYWNAPPENGYGFLFNVRQGLTVGAAPKFIWRVGERTSSLLEGIALHTLPMPDSHYILARAKGLANAPESDYLLIRRRGHDLASRFVSVIEPFVGQQPALSATRCGPTGSRAVTKVTSANGSTAYFFESPERVLREIAFTDHDVPIRFTGQFAAVLTRAGKPVEILLFGAGAIEFGEAEVAAARNRYQAKVIAVDYEKSLVALDTPLPAGAVTGATSLAYFSRSDYSRNAPYTVHHVRPHTAGCELDLGGASLVLGQGRAVSPVSEAGVVANGVPLDREKAYGRSVRTGYFNGKAIRNLRTGQMGRIKNVNLDSSLVLDARLELRQGDRFELLDIQEGDTVDIPGVVALWQAEPGQWRLRSNVPLWINMPDAVSIAVEPPTSGRISSVETSDGKCWQFTVAGNDR